MKNVVERIYHLTDDSIITVEDLPANILSKPSISPKNIEGDEEELPKLKEAVTRFEENYIKQMLERTSSLQECSDRLGISLSTLVRKKRGIKVIM